jgi:GAF domain-containing protein
MSPPDASVGAAPPTREQRFTEVFIAFADTLVDDYDVVELLDRLVTVCVEILPVSAAGLLLDDQRGKLAVVASSSEETRLLEVFQLQNDEGPCLDCIRTGSAVTISEIEAEAERWPLFVPASLRAGFRSVAAVPLRLRAQVIGGLNLFDAEPGAVSEDSRRLAQALADVATIGILQRRSTHRGDLVAEQLQHALNSRVVIEQAKGVIAERNGISMEQAFELLRTRSRSSNEKLTAVARAVVQGQPGAAIVEGADPR